MFSSVNTVQERPTDDVIYTTIHDHDKGIPLGGHLKHKPPLQAITAGVMRSTRSYLRQVVEKGRADGYGQGHDWATTRALKQPARVRDGL